MRIRHYVEEDDAALMLLERQCPRGEPEPFVHFRRRFADRAALFRDYFLLLIEQQGAIIAAIAAGIKVTQANGQPLRLGYIFDARVAPAGRRQGLAGALLGAAEDELRARGCDGAYAHIVATNVPSLRLFGSAGFERRRQLRFLTYQPFPLLFDAPAPVERHAASSFPPTPTEPYAAHDLWEAGLATALAPYDLEAWCCGEARFSSYDQSQLFQQVPWDAPWPTLEEIARRGRHWRLFDPLGPAPALETLFATIRDAAVGEGIDKLTMLVDAQEPIPSFFYAEASAQREYVIVTRSFTPAWDGSFGPRLYADTREL